MPAKATPKTRSSSLSQKKRKKSVPRLRVQFVLFLDLLGFRERIAMARNSRKKMQQLLTEFDHVVGNAVNKVLVPDEWATWRYKGFTDNFVLTVDVREGSEAETELGTLLIRAGEFQLQLALQGWFLRGGLAVEWNYMDDRLVFGAGLIDAYELESVQARDPRILLSPKVQRLTRMHLRYYADPFFAPHNGYILLDQDDRMFINYLYVPRGNEEEPAVQTRVLAEHKIRVESALERAKGKPSIWAKYRWVAEYHDFFCRKWAKSETNLLIAQSALRGGPTLLVPRRNRKVPLDAAM